MSDGKATEVADALDEFADIDEAEGGNPRVIATERRAAKMLRAIGDISFEFKGKLYVRTLDGKVAAIAILPSALIQDIQS